MGDDLAEAIVVDNTTDLVTVKTLASGDSTPNEGDTVTFNIMVANNGGAQATNVSLTDLLPQGLRATVNNGTVVLGGAYDPVTGLWIIGTLDVGQTATLTLEGTVDAGQGGNTITNLTTAATGDQTDPSTVGDDLEESVAVLTPVLLEPAIGLAKDVSNVAANGDNFDVTFSLVWQNIGNTALDNVVVNDDVADLFGEQFVGIVPGSVAITSFTGSGTAPSVNAGFEGDTTQSLITSNGPLAVGDQFGVVFTVTIDPDAVVNFDGLVNQATSAGNAVNEAGALITDGTGNQLTAFDDSDNGVDPTGENGEDNGDGTFANDVTPVQIADLGIAKSIVGEPGLLSNGNYVVTYQLVVQNTGTVDLANLSLVENLTAQFGGALAGAGNLQLVSGPTDPDSNVALNFAGWDGSSVTDLVDQGVANRLVVGDTITIEFAAEINPTQVDGQLENQVVGTGTAVDENGQGIVGADGQTLSASDLSDSGRVANGTNPNEPGDNGTSDDPVPFTPPAVPLSAISGVVFQDSNNDGIQQDGEAGIAGVQVTLIGEDVYGNPVNITVVTDANGEYVFSGLTAGTYRLIENQPFGFEDGIDNGDPGFTAANDEFSDIQLGFGESIGGITFGELQQQDTPGTTSGRPAQFRGILPIFNTPISRFFNVGGPGTIYSGIPINANSNPLTLDSGRPVTGGYMATEGGAGDGGCCEEIDYSSQPIPESVNWSEQPMVDGVITEDCGCDGDYSDGEVYTEGESLVRPAYQDQVEEPVEEPVEEHVQGECHCETDCSCNVDPVIPGDLPAPSHEGLRGPGFLKRFGGWMHQ